jgi:hypothetical protein
MATESNSAGGCNNHSSKVWNRHEHTDTVLLACVAARQALRITAVLSAKPGVDIEPVLCSMQMILSPPQCKKQPDTQGGLMATSKGTMGGSNQRQLWTGICRYPPSVHVYLSVCFIVLVASLCFSDLMQIVQPQTYRSSSSSSNSSNTSVQQPTCRCTIQGSVLCWGSVAFVSHLLLHKWAFSDACGLLTTATYQAQAAAQHRQMAGPPKVACAWSLHPPIQH